MSAESDLAELVRDDEWMMRVLRCADSVGLPDWWIGAGFLRNAVWDRLSGREPRHDSDVDLAYFDPTSIATDRDWRMDEELRSRFPFAVWEVRNQARMYVQDGFAPYRSTRDGIAHWVETATCVGVRLLDGEPDFLFCYGAEDLLGLVARPIPDYRSADRITVFRERIAKKQWNERWPGLRIAE